MPLTKKRQRLAGSERKMLPNAKAVGKVDPKERIEVAIMVRPKSPPQVASTHAEEAMSMGAALPEDRQYLNRGEQFAEQRGADPADFDKIEEFAHEHNLTVTMTSIAQRIIKLSGTIADLQNAFKANLKKYRMAKITFRGRTGSLSVPTELAPIIVGIYGFDTRPAAMPHFRILAPQSTFSSKAIKPQSSKAGSKVGGKAAKKKIASSKLAAAPAATAQLQSFTAPAVAKLYNFPVGLNGAGQCIALIELNTPDQNTGQLGTGFTTSDLKTYFKKLNLPMPQVTAVGVGGGANLPNINRNADVEVMLDIEVAGAVAPGAQVAVYFAPNTSKGFLEAISAAVHDAVRKPSVVSISWGGPEDPPFSTKQFRDGLAQVLQDASTLGVTVSCAAGDNGSFDIEKFQTDQSGNPLRGGSPHVDFPCSSPFALACGGTTLAGSGATISSEVVWNEGDPTTPNDQHPRGSTGGGVSNFFGKPSYQTNAQVPKSPQNKIGRGVPDVAGDADSASGYLCKISGVSQLVPVGGTSAVAPLWAGLIALINQRLAALNKKTAGFVNPILYNSPNTFHDITQGNNDIDGTLKKYQAGTGWDPCTGLGTPDGTKVMQALGG